jgi:hypothetical protein
MRVDPEGIYLRLEPAVHIINRSTGKVRSVAGVEIHWKDGRRWERLTLVAPVDDPTLAAALRQVAELIDTFPELEAALDTLRAS